MKSQITFDKSGIKIESQLDKVEVSFLTMLMLTDLMENREHKILKAVGQERLSKLFKVLDEVDYATLTFEEQQDKAKALFNKLLCLLGIN